MKIVSIICLWIALSGVGYAQDWYAELQHKNVHVYVCNYDSSLVMMSEMAYNRDTPVSEDTSDIVNTIGMGRGEAAQTSHPEAWTLLGRSYTVFTDYRRYKYGGFVLGEHCKQKTDTIPQFYAIYPGKDTVIDLRDSLGIVLRDFRKMDTTIYGYSLPSFSYTWESEKSNYTVIVSKPVGIVRIIDQDSDREWFLSSAVIGKRIFNRDTISFRSMRFCDSYRCTYRHSYCSGFSRQYECSVRDTIIGGIAYKRHVSSTPVEFANMRYRNYNAVSDVFRYEGDTLIQLLDGVEAQSPDVSVSLGDVVLLPPDRYDPMECHIVADTGRALINGKWVRKRCMFIYAIDYYDVCYWYEGIGAVFTKTFSLGGIETWQLLSIQTCEDTFDFTDVEAVPIPDVYHCSAPYPNPVSSAAGVVHLAVEKPLTEAVTIRMTDVLGREVYTERYDEGLTGTALGIPLAGIQPGVYFVSVQGRSIFETQKLVVVR